MMRLRETQERQGMVSSSMLRGGDMRVFGYGSLGKDTNNVAEIEGLLQGLVCVTTNFRRLVIVEGDS